MTHDEPTPSGERRCRVGVGPDGEPIFEQFVRLSWHKAHLAGVVEQCAKVCDEIKKEQLRRPVADWNNGPDIAEECADEIRSLAPTPTDKVVRCFMDGIDWQHELGQASDGVELFPSLEDTKREKKCFASGGRCGVVEVEVRLVRWVEEQDLRGERNAARAANNVPPQAPDEKERT